MPTTLVNSDNLTDRKLGVLSSWDFGSPKAVWKSNFHGREMSRLSSFVMYSFVLNILTPDILQTRETCMSAHSCRETAPGHVSHAPFFSAQAIALWFAQNHSVAASLNLGPRTHLDQDLKHENKTMICCMNHHSQEHRFTQMLGGFQSR